MGLSGSLTMDLAWLDEADISLRSLGGVRALHCQVKAVGRQVRDRRFGLERAEGIF
jgi:hypothetical protein